MDTTIEQYKPKRLLNSLVACFLDNEDVYLNDFVESLPKGLFKEVIPTTNSREAISLASSKSIDVLVCDFRMPEQDGISVLELCRKENPNLISILSTGYVLSQDDLKKCEELGIEKVSKIEPLDTLLASISVKANELEGFSKDNFITLHIERELLLTQKFRSLISKSEHAVNIAHQREVPVAVHNELMSLFKELSQILIDRYSKISNLEKVLIVTSPNESTSLKDLIEDLKNMTPKGLHHLELWLKVNTHEQNDDTKLFSPSKKPEK